MACDISPQTSLPSKNLPFWHDSFVFLLISVDKIYILHQHYHINYQ